MEELPALIAAELKAAAANEDKTITAIHPEAMDKLVAYPWPGNLRELNHTVRTIDAFLRGPRHPARTRRLPAGFEIHSRTAGLQAVDPSPQPNGSAEGVRDLSLANAVASHVRFVYEQAGRNQRRTARLLGISRATLARHLRRKDQK